MDQDCHWRFIQILEEFLDCPSYSNFLSGISANNDSFYLSSGPLICNKSIFFIIFQFFPTYCFTYFLILTNYVDEICCIGKLRI